MDRHSQRRGLITARARRVPTGFERPQRTEPQLKPPVGGLQGAAAQTLNRHLEALRVPPSLLAPVEASAPPPTVFEAPQPLQEGPPATGLMAKLGALRRSVGAGHAITSATPETPVDALSAALPGSERATEHGPTYAIELTYPPRATHGNRELGAVLHQPARPAVLSGEAELGGFDVRRALFLDLETTGLAHGMGTLAFLAGTAHFRGEDLILEQWLLRQPDEEPAFLADLAARMADVDYLVTFNGRTFDLPLLQGRYSANRMEDPAAHLLGHLDLLHASRRLLRHDLPNCKLQTIEAHKLGFLRVDDVPGSECPARYRAYLHGDDPHGLIPLVVHNRDDVLSMVTLLDLLLQRVEQAEAWLWRDPDCGLALAALGLRAGDLDYSESIYRSAAVLPETRAAGEKGLRRVERLKKRMLRSGASSH